MTVSRSTGNASPDKLLDMQASAMPVTVITRQMIEKMGSRRLDEILKEQTGLAVVSDISGGARATGIQMQGFSSEYIMVLIDGQPMTGRNSGNFDLSRISVTNIERIEIIKGASSCLFGSDALGGAINIVTRHGAPQSLASITQTLHRLEQQLAWAPGSQLKFTGGFGGSVEVMNTSSFKTGNNMAAGFAYLQTNYIPATTTELTGGLRYDRHNTYGGKLNPSIGLQQKIFSQITFRVSAGTGFKAPDFKTHYQVFVTPLSTYMVVGTEALAATLEQLNKAGRSARSATTC